MSKCADRAPLALEPARPEDMGEVVRVFNAAWLPVGLRLGATREGAPGFPAHVTQAAFEEYVAEHNTRVFIGRVCEIAVACGGWSPDPEDPQGAWLNRLAVLPEYQGRGHGKALVKFLEGQVVQAGLKVIRLGHVAAEEGLHRMYEQVGYRTTEVRPSTKWLVDITYMEKRLDEAATGGQ